MNQHRLTLAKKQIERSPAPVQHSTVESSKLAMGGAQSRIMALQHAAGNQAVHGLLQTKLAINQPGDAYEQEADRVAHRIMQTPEPAVPLEYDSADYSESIGQNETSKQKRMVIQRKVSVLGDVESAPPIVDDVLHSSGHPIELPLNRIMVAEASCGHTVLLNPPPDKQRF